MASTEDGHTPNGHGMIQTQATSSQGTFCASEGLTGTRGLGQTFASIADGQDAKTPSRPEQALEAAALSILTSIGEDTRRGGLLKTPVRFARALEELTAGYNLTVEDVANDAIFHEGHTDMVIVRDLDVYSLCEHHMLPFWGKAHIAYYPRQRVLGLSKFGRVLDVFARRLQIQERLTNDFATAIQKLLDPNGVAVVMECSHMCMSMRGVQQASTSTVTRCSTGAFCGNPELENQFYRLLELSRR